MRKGGDMITIYLLLYLVGVCDVILTVRVIYYFDGEWTGDEICLSSIKTLEPKKSWMYWLEKESLRAMTSMRKSIYLSFSMF
jgi:hypothetical protein